jgi:hypothetical protein
MKIKDRTNKKNLITKITDCSNQANFVMGELRKVKDANYLSNELIAQLNDMAYKAIKTGSLNKLLDKRAIQNENLYQKLEQKAL